MSNLLKAIPYSVVRARLAQTLRDVEAGSAPVLISRRGRPVGVLMSWSQYREATVGTAAGFADSLSRWHAAPPPTPQEGAAGDDDDDPFADVRDRSAGRSVVWPD